MITEYGISFQTLYCDLINDVYEDGKYILVRGQSCKELTPCYFELEDISTRLLNFSPTARKNIKKYIFGELMWYLSGSNKVADIEKYSKMWTKLSDDGVTNNSAYGYYIFNKQPNGISQWDWVKNKLLKDSNTRQAIIHIKPIQTYESKDYVCTLTLSFYIREGKLNLIANMRSNDLMFGTTYDVFMFTFLQELMAAELDITAGTYSHFTNNLHYYLKDEEKLLAMSKEYTNEIFNMPPVPTNFRTHDLPILLQCEKDYWNNKQLQNVNKLSQCGYFILCLLTGENYYAI